jgi:predicted MFS family arabinose efflux permease
MPHDKATAISSRSKLRLAGGKFIAVNRGANDERGTLGRRIALLRAERDFRVFYAGYATSLLGSAMSRIALSFAVLDSGGNAAELGFVFAASVFPQVLVALAGGILADRVGRRPVMLAADASRMAVQGTLALALLISHPPIWLFMLLGALLATAEGFFSPSLGGLRADIVPAGQVADANAMLSVAGSVATIAGPALSGLLVALTSPAVVIALDAASYGASVIALALLRVPPPRRPAQSAGRDLAESWQEFTSQTWLWVTTAQWALMNLFTWAPYLLLGPVLAKEYLGGAGAWGLVLAAYAGGSVLAGLGLVGRRPSRPLVLAMIGMFGFPVPCLLLAVRAPLAAVAAGAMVAGVGSAIAGTLESTVQLQRVPPGMLARISGIMLTLAFCLGSAGWAVIGPLADVLGPTPVLAFAFGFGTASSAAVLAVPAIRAVTWLPAAPDGAAADARDEPA